MSLFVNTNLSSLSAQRYSTNINSQLTTSFERLSSGFRINSAADDAAGLQISDRMTSQIAGLKQAVRNANDGISVVQTADGALEESTRILQRMRVLAVQAENGINSETDKQALQKEVFELKQELDRIANSTEFAGKALLDGTYSSSFLVGANNSQTINVSLTHSQGLGLIGLSTFGLDVVTPTSPTSEEVNEGAVITSGPDFPSGIFATVPASSGTVSGLRINVDNQGFITIPDFTLPGINSSANAQAIETAVQAAATNLIGGKPIAATSGQLLLSGNTNSVIFELAPDSDLNLVSSLTGISSQLLNSTELGNYRSNIEIIDGAISTVGTQRAKLGALQNRFQSTIRNLSNISENVSSAQSRIRDTDYALETANLTRSQIVQQASVSVLAQANNRPQNALTLLS